MKYKLFALKIFFCRIWARITGRPVVTATQVVGRISSEKVKEFVKLRDELKASGKDYPGRINEQYGVKFVGKFKKEDVK